MAYQVLNGDLFCNMMISAREYLDRCKSQVDALNVFPVPDGDTGTNMYLTISSAVESLKDMAGMSLEEVAQEASQGALMGARGNSGVILSQILRGIARGFAGREEARPEDIVQALDEAVTTAYKAVMKPVEGTILTVLRGMRDGAREACRPEASVDDIMNGCLIMGREVLDRTPDMLPVLKQAGVVDAGGKGLLCILEGAFETLQQETGAKSVRSITVPEAGMAEPGHEPEVSEITYPYDTQLLIAGENLPLDEIRRKLEAYGDSLLVVGQETLVRVHIHTGVPGEVLTLCQQYGSLSQVTVDNMVEQAVAARGTRRLLNASGSGVSFDRPALVPIVAEQPGQVKETGIVSVATGQGLKDIMQSLGCDLVIDGGSTMNPSTQELASAVKTVNARRIIFMPNNGNIFLAAKQAKKLTGRTMYIVPSKTIPQGISALLSLNLNEDMKSNLKRASRAIKRVKTGEVTFSARDGKFGKHAMKRGDILGLVDGKVEMVGSDPEDVLLSVVRRMVKDGDEIVTVYYGEEVDHARAESVAHSLRKALGPEVEVEVHSGGQPLYYYIVSAE